MDDKSFWWKNLISKSLAFHCSHHIFLSFSINNPPPPKPHSDSNFSPLIRPFLSPPPLRSYNPSSGPFIPSFPPILQPLIRPFHPLLPPILQPLIRPFYPLLPFDLTTPHPALSSPPSLRSYNPSSGLFIPWPPWPPKPLYMLKPFQILMVNLI